MKDPELLELCKQVYDRTGWTVTPGHIDYAYTSDYLFEQLPWRIESKEYPPRKAELRVGKTQEDMYHVWYYCIGIQDVVSDFGESSDSTLKALLKLTLALCDAGVLEDKQ